MRPTGFMLAEKADGLALAQDQVCKVNHHSPFHESRLCQTAVSDRTTLGGLTQFHAMMAFDASVNR